MIFSMTGYGRAQQSCNGRAVTIEIKSVNSRYFEYSSRLPRAYGWVDDRLKKQLAAAISRGKVELSLTVLQLEEGQVAVRPNLALARQYLQALRQMGDALGLADDVTLNSLSRFPDLFATERAEPDEEQAAQDILAAEKQAIAAFAAMRAAEGEKLAQDLLGRLDRLELLLAEVEGLSAGRVQGYTQKLYEKLKLLLADREVEEARVLTEAAIFADKTAVDEETVRLHSHLQQYREILAGGGPVGRKLDFLTQELNREVNTIGSKAQDLQITRLVVEMKAEIEKIREQVQNIE